MSCERKIKLNEVQKSQTNIQLDQNLKVITFDVLKHKKSIGLVGNIMHDWKCAHFFIISMKTKFFKALLNLGTILSNKECNIENHRKSIGRVIYKEYFIGLYKR